MIRFIWQNWRRHKEKLILLLIGAVIVSGGLSYLVGMAQTNQGTIVNALEKRWSASYDIVVRPQGSRSVTEDKHLLEPNYLSGISEGISLDQFDEIKQMKGVEVAAPIAMIGYIRYFIPFQELNPKHNGVYRVHKKWSVDIGPRKNVDGGSYYFVVGPWVPDGHGDGYGAHPYDGHPLTASFQVLLAGIDPEAEAKLVGLDEAIIDIGQSRYFKGSDKSHSHHIEGLNETLKQTEIPVLISNREFVDETYTYTVEKLDLPFNNKKVFHKTMEMVKEKGGKPYLNKVLAVDSGQRYSITAEKAHKRLLKKITGIDPKSGKKATLPFDDKGRDFHWMAFRPSPLHVRPVTSPFSKRWPFAYESKTFQDETPVFPTVPKETYRPVNVFGTDSSGWLRVETNWIGIYDPGKLKISQDPLTQLPMETYRPASAKLALDPNGEPINPLIEIKPADNSYSFLTKPPMMLTTIEAAEKLLGDHPISAIRIKVAGVDELTEKSQQKLEEIAGEIENKTGLITDITLGSSPQPALTHIPAKGDIPELGWIQQPWVKLGSSFAIFKETKVGFSGVIGSVMLVAVVYVFASLLVSLLARRKEFAVLLAIGWRPRQLSKLVFLEAGILGVFVAVVSWTILGLVLSVHQTETSLTRLFLTGLFGLVIYELGAVIPAILATHIKPSEALQSGEISQNSRRWLRTRSIFSMSLNHLFGKWRRSQLSIAAIAVPSSLLAFFLFVTFRLKGVMYTTWLGQYVALEVGPQHYVAMAVALLIAILTTAEVMWQNVSERQPEISLLRAIGWSGQSVRWLVLLEGGFSGMAAAIVGLAAALGIIWGMYSKIPVDNIGFLLATGIIPVVTGLIGAIFPAERAVRILPSQGVKGRYSNKRNSEKYFSMGLGISSLILISCFVYMAFTTIPMINNQKDNKASQNENVAPTSGEPLAKSSTSEPIPSEDVKENTDLNIVEGTLIEVGEIYRVGGAMLSADKLVPLPLNSNVGKPEKGMKYVSVQLSFKNKLEVGNFSYRPFYSTLYTKDGEKEVADWSVVQNKGWNNGYLESGGHVTIVLTFEVKKNVREMIVALPSYFAPRKINIRLK
ncbi:MAG TPA: FtsX-like permease family protein [Bacillales bacterium]|nr:FtsX-like permease family protein [Bacillales bacterium]